jgi:hypothetical protein
MVSRSGRIISVLWCRGIAAEAEAFGMWSASRSWRRRRWKSDGP